MERNTEFEGSHPRRRFLASFLAGVAGVAALLLSPRRASAAGKKSTGQAATGPILYRRTEETERYYRTLYR